MQGRKPIRQNTSASAASRGIPRGSGKKVFVGMSGGVDSSVSAALLVAAGYDVTGVFIKVWQPDRDISGLKCTWREDRLDAMRVAARLGIPFTTLDLEDEYKRHVVDYMIAEYRAGRTPNPDVMCNKYVKFGGFFDWAMARGGDFVATGHYARVRISEKNFKKDESGQAKYELLAGEDPNKDQSYFLWTLTEHQLARTLFPVGDMEKPHVRKLAQKFNLPNAEKKDSQGLCFIGKIDIKEFLSHYIEPKRGDALAGDSRGKKKIGHHDGAFFFTMGERHGFTIDDAHKTPHDVPYYVVAKDIEANTITVSQKSQKDLITVAADDVQKVSAITLMETNWISGTPEIGKKYTAKPRYRAPLVSVTIRAVAEKDHTAEIVFAEPQETISPGQSLVVYDGDICLGGGIIS